MNLDEYAENQRLLIQALVKFLTAILEPFREPQLDDRAWAAVLIAIYPRVAEARDISAELGREFYDSQRAVMLPGAARQDVLLESYKPEWMAEALEPVKKRFQQANASEAVNELVLRVITQVENGGRKTILRAVDEEWDDSPEPEIKAWARIATGRETCAFCLMMVSRGPVYLSAETAGLDADDTTAAELWEQGDEQALDALMRRWHPGCDCKVVPVYDRASWPGRDAYLVAERIWKRTTKGKSGKDALNAFRRAIEAGQIEPAQFAAIAV